MANTGYLIQPQLKRVTDDENEFPLDENDNLCSVSGLPQATMDNPPEDPSYRILDYDSCPVPTEPYYLSLEDRPTTGTNRELVARLSNEFGAAVTVSESITFDWTGISQPKPSGTPFTFNESNILIAGNSEVIVKNYDFNDEEISSLGTSNPNPSTVDGHEIITG